jgi:hypothetical protein
VASDDDDDEHDIVEEYPRSYNQAYDRRDDDLLDALGTPLLLSWDHDDEHDVHHHHPSSSDINTIMASPPPPRLNGLNYLNSATYVLNVFVSYGIGYTGLYGILPTRWEISKRFETLVTPAEWAYYLWVPILLFECVFALAQLSRNYRARPIVQEGTSFYFFWTCVLQTAWTILFAFELFLLSFVAVVLSLLSLASLLASQQYSLQKRRRFTRKSNLTEYWLFRFPFYIHTGWLILCSVVQWSMMIRYYTNDNVGVQLAADVVSLAVLLPPATFFLTGQPAGPDFVIPAVILWSYVSIALELKHPSHHPALLEHYGSDAMVAVRDAAYFLAGIVIMMLVPRMAVWMVQECCTITVSEVLVGGDNDPDTREGPSSSSADAGHIHDDDDDDDGPPVVVVGVSPSSQRGYGPPPPPPPPEESSPWPSSTRHVSFSDRHLPGNGKDDTALDDAQ